MSVKCGNCKEHHSSAADVKACFGGAKVAAEKFDCDGVCKDGVYYGAGYVENGVFKGFTGKCFRCGGKGYQTVADQQRNSYYDNHVRKVYA